MTKAFNPDSTGRSRLETLIGNPARVHSETLVPCGHEGCVDEGLWHPASTMRCPARRALNARVREESQGSRLQATVSDVFAAARCPKHVPHRGWGRFLIPLLESFVVHKHEERAQGSSHRKRTRRSGEHGIGHEQGEKFRNPGKFGRTPVAVRR